LLGCLGDGDFVDLTFYFRLIKILHLPQVGHGFAQVLAEAGIQGFETGDDLMTDVVSLENDFAVGVVMAIGHFPGGGPGFDFPAVGEEERTNQGSRFFAEAGNSFDSCFPDQVNEESFDQVILVVCGGDNVIPFGSLDFSEPCIAEFPGGHLD